MIFCLRTFRKIDTDTDGFISEEEWIGHMLRTNRLSSGVVDLEGYGPASQIDNLLRQIGQTQHTYTEMGNLFGRVLGMMGQDPK